MAPFFDPESSPALDALRRDCLEELSHNFPLSADARTCAVVLVCGDMRVESADWLALVLAIDRLERDGVLFVKPLETSEDERPEPDADEGSGRKKGKRRKRRRSASARPEPAPQGGPTRLRVAVSAPAQALPAAAVMDCLRFEDARSARSGGATGSVRRRSAVPPADADRAVLRAEYVFSPGPELRRRLLRKHSGSSPESDFGLIGSGSDADSGRSNIEDDDTEHDSKRERRDLAVASTACFDNPVFDDASPGAVTVFEGTSRLTRRRKTKPPRSTSAAPAPAALRQQTQQRSGSAALRDALEAASAAGAMTLHVRVADVADAIAELDELRARLDRAEK